MLTPPVAAWAQKQEGGPAEVSRIQVDYEKVNPSDGFNYGLKRFKEKLLLILPLRSAKSKAKLYEQFTKNRLAELKYVIDQKDMANFENATTRYFTTVGQFTDFLTKNGSTDQKSQAIKNLSLHIPVLEDLRDTFEGQEKAEWRFIQDDINYTKMYIDQLK